MLYTVLLRLLGHMLYSGTCDTPSQAPYVDVATVAYVPNTLPTSHSLSLSLSLSHTHTYTHTQCFTHTHIHTHNTLPISHVAYIPKRVTKRVSLSSEQKRIRATNPYTKEFRDSAFPEAHTEQVYFLNLNFNQLV